MAAEEPFRTVLLIAFAILIPVMLFFRLRSQSTGEKLDRRKEGWFILLTLRPIGITCMGCLIAYIINPLSMTWSSVPLPSYVRWSGAIIGVFGGAMLVWTMGSLGKNLTDTVVTRREHELVTRGPYRWIRHPFYVSGALAILANSLLTANWFIFLTGFLAVCLQIKRLPIEEAMLIERFGDSYRDYMRTTPAFFPRFHS